MSLSVRARVVERDVEFALELRAGERVALIGPNGAGKSTVLSVLAGTLRPDKGRAELDGRVLFDLDERGRGRRRPPHARGVALLAQDPLLFPHLSAAQNVAFGPRSVGGSRAEARATAARWLAAVHATDLAERRPAQLSGGQAQRIAVARALATEPSLLLLDEPLAALDVGTAPVLRRLLREVLADRTVILVTHDLLDAWLLADRVIVMEAGRVVEDGPTDQVLRRPRTRFAARLAGLNLLNGVARDGALIEPDGTMIMGRPDPSLADGEAAVAAFGPQAVSIYATSPHGSPRNTLAVTVLELEPRDDLVRVRAQDAAGRVLTADVTAAAISELDLVPGQTVHFSIKATAVTLYPA